MNLDHALALALTAATLVTSPAARAAHGPSDADLLGARTVGVLPVLVTGPSAAAWTRLGVSLSLPVTAADAPRVAVPAFEPGVADGLAFAGTADDADVRILRYGYFLGLMPALVASSNASREATAAKLLGSIDTLTPLGPEVVAAVRAALARPDEVDGAASARVMALAQRGLADGDARKHGYLASGMWLGLTLLAVWQAEVDETLLGMAGPLADLLEEDAAFGGTDRGVAGVLRGVAEALGQRPVDASRVMHLGATVLELDPDRAR